MQFWEKFALTTVQIALGFASCNFSVAMQFFPKLHSRPCDYLYILCSHMCANSEKFGVHKINFVGVQV